MNRTHFIKPIPIKKKPVAIYLSNDSDSDYSYSSDIINVQDKIVNRSEKVPEQRPRSQRNLKQKDITMLLGNKENSPSLNKSSASFLSDEEIQHEPPRRPISFSSTSRNPGKVFPNQEKPDLRKNLNESPQISIQKDQDDHEQHRKRKKKKVRSRVVAQADISEKSASIEEFNQIQQPQQIPQGQEIQQRTLRPQPPPQQQQSQVQNQNSQQQLQRQQQQQQNTFSQNHDLKQQINRQNQQQRQLTPPQSQEVALQPRPQSTQTQSVQPRSLQRNLPSRITSRQQSQPQSSPLRQLPGVQNYQQKQIQQKQSQIQKNPAIQQEIQEQEQPQEQVRTSDSTLPRTTPARKRYNSNKNIEEIVTSSPNEISNQNKISKEVNNVKQFPKPNYQFFGRPNLPEKLSITTDTESTQEEDMVPRKRKKVKSKSKLSISESNYINFYYNSKAPIEIPQGELIVQANVCKIRSFSTQNTKSPNRKVPPLPTLPTNPNFTNGLPGVQVKPQAQTSRPIPIPKMYNISNNQEPIYNRNSKTVTEEDEYIRSGTEYESEPSEIQLSRSSGSNGNLIKAFMSASVFNDLNETYNPTNEEQQQAFQDPLDITTSTLTFHRVPTLSVFEQNANNNGGNQDEIMTNPSIAFSKLCFDITPDSPLTKGHLNNDFEDGIDYNNIQLDAQQPVEDIPYDDNEGLETSPWLNGSIPKKNIPLRNANRPPSANLTLLDMIPANKDTKPEFKTLENNYRKIVDGCSQNVGTTMRPKDNLIEYKLTTTVQPDEGDVTTYEQEGFYCLEKITPKAFMGFKFGFQVTEPNPDILHIFTWHNLSISQGEITNSLFGLVSKIEGNESDIPQIKSVIQYIFSWIYLFAVDFYGNVEICSLLRKVLNILLEKSKPVGSHVSVIANDICFLKACLDSLSSKNSTPENYSIPINKPTKLPNNYFRSMNLKELKVEPSILVRHFTYVELELFKKIDRSEIIKQVTHHFESKEQKEKLLPNYTNYYVRFNSTAVFIAMSIMVEGSKNRAKRLEYWIKVMEEARKFRNYFLLFEIDAALSCFPINRLEKSWKKVSKRSIALFNVLHLITNPTSKQIIAYKKEVNSFPALTMPYIGPFLTELRYIYEGKKVMMSLPNGKEAYNMKYQRAFCNVLELIFQDWGTQIQFQIDNVLLEQCINLEGKEQKTEDLMPYSTKFEPPSS